MTPAQLEHLKLIDAHLERLLERASCAGNAEAGWRATRAAIALCIANLNTDPEFPTHEAGEICDNDGQGWPSLRIH